MGRGSFVLDRRENALGRSKSVGLRVLLGVGYDPTMAPWLDKLLWLLAHGLLPRTGPTLVSCLEGSDPNGPSDMGSGGNLTTVPSFSFLIYSPVQSCRLASGVSLGWEG